MDNQTKITLFSELDGNKPLRESAYYRVLEQCDALKSDYHEYMTTAPIDCDTELLRLPNADYDLCCALLTMLLREDHFSNGSFHRRQLQGQVTPIVKRIIHLLKATATPRLSAFSERALEALHGFYVYALVDPRCDRIFYIGKGTGNRVFAHELESKKAQITSEKEKLHTIHEIEKDGFRIKRLILNWGLTEEEAFASEASLINLLNWLPDTKLTNQVSGHHVHEGLTVEEFERLYGAVPLAPEDIRHNVLVIKINKLYRRDMSAAELYDTVRGYWAASMRSIKARGVEYVFGVYNGLIVAVYKPDEWHYGHERIDAPQADLISPQDYDRLKDRIYFICKDHLQLDEAGRFYLHKSIERLKASQSAQNPITYLSPIVQQDKE